MYRSSTIIISNAHPKSVTRILCDSTMIAFILPILAAAGYSLVYLLLGGGLGGAILIFIIAKMLGK